MSSTKQNSKLSVRQAKRQQRFEQLKGVFENDRLLSALYLAVKVVCAHETLLCCIMIAVILPCTLMLNHTPLVVLPIPALTLLAVCFVYVGLTEYRCSMMIFYIILKLLVCFVTLPSLWALSRSAKTVAGGSDRLGSNLVMPCLLAVWMYWLLSVMFIVIVIIMARTMWSLEMCFDRKMSVRL